MWSATVNGIKGRLVVAFEDLKPGLRHAIYLEIMNESFKAVAITNQPDMHAQLYDASGNPVATSGSFSNGPQPVLQWAVIPTSSYLGIRIDLQTIGVPTREHKRVLLAPADQAWELTSGRYLLEASAEFKRDNAGPQNQWVGTLELPATEIEVIDEMFSE